MACKQLAILALERSKNKLLIKPAMEETKPLERIKESSVVGAEEVGNEEDDDLVFPGFRFHPTDQELVGFYLARKVEKKSFSIDIIKEIDIYKHDPWDLPNEARHGVLQGASGDNKDRYFFCLRGRKYRNSIRPNRVTGSGFWKATGIDKPIHGGGGGGGECLGLKKSLVYYRGSAGRGTKTDWMMHEFRLPSTPSSAEELQDAGIWTICRIFKRNMSYNRRCQQQQQKQEHGGSKRSHHQQKQQQLESYYDYHYLHQQKQQQLQYYYDYHYLHHQHRASMAAMTSSFDSSETEAYATNPHHQPFLLHGFHGVPSAVTSTAAATSGLVGAPNYLLPSTTSGWSEVTTFRESDGSTCWDELGRIMEISQIQPS